MTKQVHFVPGGHTARAQYDASPAHVVPSKTLIWGGATPARVTTGAKPWPSVLAVVNEPVESKPN